jgi:predicted secreted protein
MAGIDAFGTTLAVGATTIGELTNIDVLDVSADDYDVTTHDSTDQWREFIGGLKDGGTLSGDLNFDPADHGTILDLVGETDQIVITLPADADDATVTFDGYINGLSAAAPHDGQLEAEISIKVTGEPVLDIPA